MTTDPKHSLVPLKISVRISDCEFLDFWRIRATAKYNDVDYVETDLIPKDSFLPTVPTLMGKLVREVAHQIVAAAVGQKNASHGGR